jgi:hypothetical protein
MGTHTVNGPGIRTPSLRGRCAFHARRVRWRGWKESPRCILLHMT